MEILLLTTAFMIKHFICDYPLQKPYQFMNKGTYGHPGGILHASIHGLGTLIILFGAAKLLPGSFSNTTIGDILLLTLLESTIHYHVDWAKTKLNGNYKLTPSDEKFWWLLGLDQLAHNLTYIGIIWAIT